MNQKNKKNQTAVLIVDMQKGVISNAFSRDLVAANINRLVERARAKNVHVFWVQHSDETLKENTEDWKLVSDLNFDPVERVIHKKYGDSFEDTTLDSELKSHGIHRLLIAGAQTDGCIRATLHGAFVRGYDTVLVADAHTTEDLTAYGLPSPEIIINFTNTYWNWQSAPGRKGSVIKTDEILFDF